MDNFEEIRILGQGAYGLIMLARDLKSKRYVCLKKICTDGMSDDELAAVLNEVEVISRFDHPNIISFYESFFDENEADFVIVMDFADSGDLSKLLKKRRKNNRYLLEDQIMDVFIQIVLALAHMHENRILHRDLKTSNIFVCSGGVIKLGDFGISRVLEPGDFAKTSIGTPYYLSPEICEDKPYNDKSDIWSLGCVLYELCCLKYAFKANSLPALILSILSGRYEPIPDSMPFELHQLVDDLLKVDPTKRPSARDILNMPYVRRHQERWLNRHTTIKKQVAEQESRQEPAKPANATWKRNANDNYEQLMELQAGLASFSEGKASPANHNVRSPVAPEPTAEPKVRRQKPRANSRTKESSRATKEKNRVQRNNSRARLMAKHADKDPKKEHKILKRDRSRIQSQEDLKKHEQELKRLKNVKGRLSIREIRAQAKKKAKMNETTVAIPETHSPVKSKYEEENNERKEMMKNKRKKERAALSSFLKQRRKKTKKDDFIVEVCVPNATRPKPVETVSNDIPVQIYVPERSAPIPTEPPVINRFTPSEENLMDNDDDVTVVISNEEMQEIQRSLNENAAGLLDDNMSTDEDSIDYDEFQTALPNQLNSIKNLYDVENISTLISTVVASPTKSYKTTPEVVDDSTDYVDKSNLMRKIEELRMLLETQLGFDDLMVLYNYFHRTIHNTQNDKPTVVAALETMSSNQNEDIETIFSKFSSTKTIQIITQLIQLIHWETDLLR
ncbi:hypothetical protein PCE1_004164 [Barthelona sp. PCE]